MALRRNLLAALVVAAPATLLSLRTLASPSSPDRPLVDSQADGLASGLADIERRHGGRLGATVIDTGSHQLLALRGNQRFALNSTFKILAAAAVLARVDKGRESLDRRLRYGRDQLQHYSPATSEHAGSDGMTLRAIAASAVELSDNTAGNLLLDSLGGPSALTAWLRTIGDTQTRVDRREPTVNDVAPGDPRDTTTPIAMAATLERLLLSDVLAASSRTQLRKWMIGSETGRHRLRADLPQEWTAGDKTGTGPRNETNDVAVFWPPGRAPLVVTAYYNQSAASEPIRSVVLAEVGALAVRLAGERPARHTYPQK